MSKCLYKDIANNLDKLELQEYYFTHTCEDTAEHFNFHVRYLYRILHYLNIDVGSKDRYSYISKNIVCTSTRNQKIQSKHLGAKRSDIARQHMKEAQALLGHSHLVQAGKPHRFKQGQKPWNAGQTGVVHWSPEQFQKYNNSLQNNNWFNNSKVEEQLYKDLCEQYGEYNVIRQYRDEIRYPFNCDFYIPSEDLFIELNRFWHHGPHKFDINNSEDLELVNYWKSKAFDNNQYVQAINTWTQRDIKKYEYAEQYNLNYKVIY